MGDGVETNQFGGYGRAGEEMNVMMIGDVDEGVEGTGILDKDSLIVKDDLMSREDPGQHKDEPDMELVITQNVSPSSDEMGIARFRGRVKEDVLLDTSSLLDGEDKDKDVSQGPVQGGAGA